MNTPIKFIIIFSSLAFFISFSCGLVAGNKFFSVLVQSVISIIVFAFLGYVVFYLLSEKVPEVIQVLENPNTDFSKQNISTSNNNGNIDENKYTKYLDNTDIGDELPLNKSQSQSSENTKMPDDLDGGNAPDMKKIKQKKSKKLEGDTLVVDNIEIKNEPKLMAEAVRTMMQKDEEK